MLGKLKRFGKDLVDSWMDNRLSVYGAALSFFTLFALGPLLILSVYMLTIVFGEERSRNFYFEILERVGSDYLLQAGKTVLKSDLASDPNYIISIVGIFTLAVGCVLFFNCLQSALNEIWGEQKDGDENPILMFFQFVMKSLVMPVLIGLFLIFTLSFRMILGFLKDELPEVLQLSKVLDLGFISDLTSVVLIGVLFAVSLQWLTRFRIPAVYAWLIGPIMSLAVVFGKIVFAWYAQRQSVSSFYGTASSLIILMLWIYISVRLFLLFNVVAKVTLDRRAKIKIAG